MFLRPVSFGENRATAVRPRADGKTVISMADLFVLPPSLSPSFIGRFLLLSFVHDEINRQKKKFCQITTLRASRKHYLIQNNNRILQNGIRQHCDNRRRSEHRYRSLSVTESNDRHGTIDVRLRVCNIFGHFSPMLYKFYGG